MWPRPWKAKMILTYVQTSEEQLYSDVCHGGVVGLNMFLTEDGCCSLSPWCIKLCSKCFCISWPPHSSNSSFFLEIYITNGSFYFSDFSINQSWFRVFLFLKVNLDKSYLIFLYKMSYTWIQRQRYDAFRWFSVNMRPVSVPERSKMQAVIQMSGNGPITRLDSLFFFRPSHFSSDPSVFFTVTKLHIYESTHIYLRL